MEPTRTPDEWLQQPPYKGIVVMDPDGWDRENYAASWGEPITEAEFNRRLCQSTCSWPRELL